jgi:calcium-dependent protein kinase
MFSCVGRPAKIKAGGAYIRRPSGSKAPASEDEVATTTSARLKNPDLATRSMSVLGNFVKEYEGSVWETYEMKAGRNLGRGAGGEVVEAAHKSTQRKYAIKIINISNPKYHSLVENEKLILQDLDHLNCVRLYEVYGIGLTQMWFVMELCTGGHLGQHIAARSRGHLSESRARSYATQLVSVVAHCHERKVCHRDIKLANILMEGKMHDTPLKLIDFGNSSRFVTGSLMKRIAGTTYSTAPEVFQRKGYHEKVDVWSIGVMVYIMLCGRRPFERIDIPNQPEASEASLISSILLGRYHFNHAPFRDVSDEAIHFICSCFEPFRDKRMSPLELINHPWLVSMVNNDHSPVHMSEKSVSISVDKHSSSSKNNSSNNNVKEIEMNVAGAEAQANYANRTTFSRTSMLGVAFSIPPSKTRLLRKTFLDMDTDRTGFLDRTEFFEAVKRSTASMTETDVSGDVNTLFDMIDIDGNNQISFLEFVAATIDPRSVDIQDLNHAFRLIDKEQKGYISLEDFQNILRTVSPQSSQRNSVVHHDGVMSTQHSGDESESRTGGEVLSDAEQRAVLELTHKRELQENLSRIIREVDVDGDGKISYSEFLFAMAEMPRTNNFIPTSLSEVNRDENHDKLHRTRHLTRGNSDGDIAYHTTNPQQKVPQAEKLSKKASSVHGSTGFFSKHFFNKNKGEGAVEQTNGSSPRNARKSSTSYFANKKDQKVHSEMHWAGTGAKKSPTDPSTDDSAAVGTGIKEVRKRSF